MRINFNNKIVAVTLILFVLLVLTGSNLTFAQEKEYKMAAVFPGSIQDQNCFVLPGSDDFHYR